MSGIRVAVIVRTRWGLRRLSLLGLILRRWAKYAKLGLGCVVRRNHDMGSAKDERICVPK